MNVENLKHGNPATQFRSGREAVENGKNGGKASGVARGFRAAFKKRMRETPELIDTVLDALGAAVAEGNVNAIKLALELSGEGYDDLDRKLKRAQIEKIKAETEAIRKRADSGGPVCENELPMLYHALEAETEGGDNDV